MNQTSLRRVLTFPHRHCSTNVLVVMLLIFSLKSSSVSQSPLPDAGKTQLAEIGRVKFVVPVGFQLDQTESDKLSFMRNRSEPLGLFVTIPEHQVNDKYLTDLSSNLVNRLRGGEDRFKWKVLGTLEPSLSRYQTNRGIIKGLKGNTFVQIDYVVLKVLDKDVVIGAIAQFGEERTATLLFDVKGREYSVAGWQGLFQVISSVTGEKER
jgi:hypothetical protein